MEKTETIDKIEEAKAFIEAENKRIAELCAKELKEATDVILKKHNCDMVIEGKFKGGQIETTFSIFKL